MAIEIAASFRLALLEPPLDLLTRLPEALLLRTMNCVPLGDVTGLAIPTFIKPADPLSGAFDAQVYRDIRDIRRRSSLPPETLVLTADPVEWLDEYRCFILEGKVMATSPYVNLGRKVWKPYGQGGASMRTPSQVLAVCERLLAQTQVTLPPAFVVDVGSIEGRGWAVVEFNPVWCAGLLAASPQKVLTVLERACRDAVTLNDADRRWVIPR
jgi:hypothetical protein